MSELHETAKALVAEGKGILAADESSGTITKRFAAIGVESTEESRRAYRDLLFTTSGVEGFISGVILFDETIRQRSADGTPFPELLASRGIIPGIKVDRGAKPLALAAGETVTRGSTGFASGSRSTESSARASPSGGRLTLSAAGARASTASG
jgi:fructose-bisphosphate aldolase class I